MVRMCIMQGVMPAVEQMGLLGGVKAAHLARQWGAASVITTSHASITHRARPDGEDAVQRQCRSPHLEVAVHVCAARRLRLLLAPGRAGVVATLLQQGAHGARDVEDGHDRAPQL